FGATLAALNASASRLFPAQPEAAVTALHAVIGLGTALPPFLLAFAAARGGWWTVPALVSACFAAVAAVAAASPLAGFEPAPGPGLASTATAEPPRPGSIPPPLLLAAV